MRTLEYEFYFVDYVGGFLQKQTLTKTPAVVQVAAASKSIEGDIGVFEYGQLGLTLENVDLTDFDGSKYSQAPVAFELRDADTSDCLFYGFIDTDAGGYDHKTDVYTCTAYSWDKWLKKIGAYNPRDVIQTTLAEPLSLTAGSTTPYQIKIKTDTEITNAIVKGSVLIISSDAPNDEKIEYRFIVESASSASGVRTCNILPSGVEELLIKGPYTGLKAWIDWDTGGLFPQLTTTYVIPIAGNEGVTIKEGDRIIFRHPTVPANDVSYRVELAQFHDHASASSAWWGIVFNVRSIASWIDDTVDFYVQSDIVINSESDTDVVGLGDDMFGVGATSTEPYDTDLLLRGILGRSARIDRMLTGVGGVEGRGETNYLPIDRRVNCSSDLTEALSDVQRSSDTFLWLDPWTTFENGVRQLKLRLRSRKGILNDEPESTLGIAVPIEYSQEIGPNPVFLVVVRGHNHFNVPTSGSEAIGWIPSGQSYLEQPPSGQGIIEIDAPLFVPSGEGSLYGAFNNRFQNDSKLASLAKRYFDVYNQYWRRGTAEIPGTDVDYLGRFVSETHTTTTGFVVKETKDYLNDSTVIEMWIGDTYIEPSNATPVARLIGGVNVFTTTEPFTAHFDASRSYDPNGDKLAFSWYKDTGGGYAVIVGETGNTLLNQSLSSGDKIKVRVTDPDGLYDEAEVTVSTIGPGLYDDGFYVFENGILLDIDINIAASTPTTEQFDYTATTVDGSDVQVEWEVYEDATLLDSGSTGVQTSPYSDSVTVNRPAGKYGSRTPYKYIRFRALNDVGDDYTSWVVVPVDRWPLPQFLIDPVVRQPIVGTLRVSWALAVDNDTTHVKTSLYRYFNDDTYAIIDSGTTHPVGDGYYEWTGLGVEVFEKGGRFLVGLEPLYDNTVDPVVTGSGWTKWVIPLQNQVPWSLTADQSQSGNTGTLDVTITDHEQTLSGGILDWRSADTPDGAFSGWTVITTNPGGAGNAGDLGDDIVTRRLTVALQDGYNSVIQVRVRQDTINDTGGNVGTMIFSFVFDADTIPNLINAWLGWEELSGTHTRNCVLTAIGREDTDAIRWFYDILDLDQAVLDHSADDWGSPDGFVAAQQCVAQLIAAVAIQKRIDVHVRGYNSATGQYGKIHIVSLENVSLPRYPTLRTEKIQINEGGIEKGRMRVYIDSDPDVVINDAQAEGRYVTGGNFTNEATGALIRQTGSPDYFELKFPLHPSHASIGEIRLPMLASSNLETFYWIATFDHDKDPELEFIDIRFGEYNSANNGWATWGSYRRDEDATLVKWDVAFEVDPSTDPTKPSPLSNSTATQEDKSLFLGYCHAGYTAHFWVEPEDANGTVVSTYHVAKTAGTPKYIEPGERNPIQRAKFFLSPAIKPWYANYEWPAWWGEWMQDNSCSFIGATDWTWVADGVQKASNTQGEHLPFDEPSAWSGINGRTSFFLVKITSDTDNANLLDWDSAYGEHKIFLRAGAADLLQYNVTGFDTNTYNHSFAIDPYNTWLIVAHRERILSDNTIISELFMHQEDGTLTYDRAVFSATTFSNTSTDLRLGDRTAKIFACVLLYIDALTEAEMRHNLGVLIKYANDLALTSSPWVSGGYVDPPSIDRPQGGVRTDLKFGFDVLGDKKGGHFITGASDYEVTNFGTARRPAIVVGDIGEDWQLLPETDGIKKLSTILGDEVLLQDPLDNGSTTVDGFTIIFLAKNPVVSSNFGRLTRSGTTDMLRWHNASTRLEINLYDDAAANTRMQFDVNTYVDDDPVLLFFTLDVDGSVTGTARQYYGGYINVDGELQVAEGVANGSSTFTVDYLRILRDNTGAGGSWRRVMMWDRAMNLNELDAQRRLMAAWARQFPGWNLNIALVEEISIAARTDTEQMSKWLPSLVDGEGLVELYPFAPTSTGEGFVYGAITGQRELPPSPLSITSEGFTAPIDGDKDWTFGNYRSYWPDPLQDFGIFFVMKAGGTGGYNTVFILSRYNNTLYRLYVDYGATSGIIRARIYDDSGTLQFSVTCTAADIPAGEWFSCLITFDRSADILRLVVQGESATESSAYEDNTPTSGSATYDEVATSTRWFDPSTEATFGPTVFAFCAIYSRFLDQAWHDRNLRQINNYLRTRGANFTTSDTQEEIATFKDINDLGPVSDWYIDLPFTWSAVDTDTIQWGAHTFTWEGSNYSIGAGNTGNMTGVTFIYFDPTISTTAYQTTTSITTATAVGVRWVATAWPGSGGSDANVVPRQGVGNVTSGSQWEAGVIDALKLAANAVTEAKILAGAVTETKISDNSISSPKIIAGAVIAGKLATDSVAAGNIIAGAVVAGKIDALAVSTSNLQADCVTTDKVGANQITSTEISAIDADVVTITAGSKVTIDSDGMEIETGVTGFSTPDPRKIAWHTPLGNERAYVAGSTLGTDEGQGVLHLNALGGTSAIVAINSSGTIQMGVYGGSGGESVYITGGVVVEVATGTSGEINLKPRSGRQNITPNASWNIALLDDTNNSLAFARIFDAPSGGEVLSWNASGYLEWIAASGGYTQWNLALTGVGGSEPITNSETVTFTAGIGITGSRSTNTITFALATSELISSNAMVSSDYLVFHDASLGDPGRRVISSAIHELLNIPSLVTVLTDNASSGVELLVKDNGVWKQITFGDLLKEFFADATDIGVSSAADLYITWDDSASIVGIVSNNDL